MKLVGVGMWLRNAVTSQFCRVAGRLHALTGHVKLDYYDYIPEVQRMIEDNADERFFEYRL